MRIKIPSLFIFCLLCSFLTFAQTTVLTTDGKTLMASSVTENEDNLSVTVNGEVQAIAKAYVLVVIPGGRPAYTFRVKNGKKITIKNKDIYYNYSGTDKPRIFAYKYQGSPSNISQLYVLNSDSSINEEQFTNIFNEQQKKFKNRNFIGMSLAIVALILGATSMISSMNT